MFSVDEIKELLRAFDSSKATSIELRNEKGELFKVSVKNETAAAVPAVPAAELTVSEKQQPAAPFIHEEKAHEDDGVNKGDVLCLIEAMKLMNEVTAEKSGEITAVCVENGQIVEYGQKLFMIK